MGNYFTKTPLTALIFAAILNFFTALALTMYSQGYSQALAGFNMPVAGYAFMAVSGFWISLIIAIIFSGAKATGMKLSFLLAVPIFGCGWLVPALSTMYFGETTGAMTRMDLFVNVACGCASAFIVLLLAAMLFKSPEKPHNPQQAAQKPGNKYKIMIKDLAVRLLVLPVIYTVIYFLSWYYLLWRSEAVRVYYTGSAGSRKFIEEIINMLLTDAGQVPMALVKGLVMSLVLLPPLAQLASKRGIFIISSIMFFACPAILMLIPSPVMPDAVRMAHLLELAVTALVFGVIASFMLHTTLHAIPGPSAGTPPPAEAKPAPKPTAAQLLAAKKAPTKPA